MSERELIDLIIFSCAIAAGANFFGFMLISMVWIYAKAYTMVNNFIKGTNS